MPKGRLETVLAIFTIPLKALLNLTVPVAGSGDDDMVVVNPIRVAALMLFLNMNFLLSLMLFFLFNIPISAFCVFVLYRFNIKPVYVTFGFVAAVLWISIFASEVVSLLKTFSLIFNISDVVLGFTVFALGNCIGDFIANFAIAKLGMPLMAFSACFGSPLLSLTSLGVSTLIVLLDTSDKWYVKGGSYTINYSPSLVLLNLGLVNNILIIYFLSKRYDWFVNEKVGISLIGNWVVLSLMCIIIEMSR